MHSPEEEKALTHLRKHTEGHIFVELGFAYRTPTGIAGKARFRNVGFPDFDAYFKIFNEENIVEFWHEFYSDFQTGSASLQGMTMSPTGRYLIWRDPGIDESLRSFLQKQPQSRREAFASIGKAIARLQESSMNSNWERSAHNWPRSRSEFDDVLETASRREAIQLRRAIPKIKALCEQLDAHCGGWMTDHVKRISYLHQFPARRTFTHGNLTWENIRVIEEEWLDVGARLIDFEQGAFRSEFYDLATLWISRGIDEADFDVVLSSY